MARETELQHRCPCCQKFGMGTKTRISVRDVTVRSDEGGGDGAGTGTGTGAGSEPRAPLTAILTTCGAGRVGKVVFKGIPTRPGHHASCWGGYSIPAKHKHSLDMGPAGTPVVVPLDFECEFRFFCAKGMSISVTPVVLV